MDKEIDVSVFSDGPPEPKRPARSPPRPWARYVAKSVDVLICSILTFPLFMVLGMVLAATDPDLLVRLETLLTGPASIVVSIALVFVVMWLLEASSISLTGGTPGKALMGFSVRAPNGKRLNLSSSLSRTFKSLVFGLGAFIPIVSLFTLIMSYRVYKDTGFAGWDDNDDNRVIARGVGPLRWTVGVALVLLERLSAVLVTLYERMAQQGQLPF